MKHFYHLLLLTIGLTTTVNAQVFFSEDFEGTMQATTDLPTAWTESGLSTDGIWSTGNSTQASSAYLTWPTPATGTNFAYTNDDACNCDKSNDLIVLPAQNFTGMTAINLSASIYLNGGYGEQLTCEVSTNGGTTWTVAYDHTPNANATAWANNVSVDLSSYAGMPSVMIAFRYNDAGSWAYGAGLDNIILQELASTEDLELLSNNGEYTLIPFSQLSTMQLDAEVSNNGNANFADVIVTANVFLGGVLQQSTSSIQSTVNAGNTQTINAGTYTPTAIGQYKVEYIVSSATIVDAIPSNDTNNYNFQVVQNYYARDNGLPTIGLGVNGTGNTAILGNNFDVTATATMDSVLTYHTAGVAGDTISYEIYTTNAGVPDVLIGISDPYIVTAANAASSGFIALAAVKDLNSSPLVLSAGTYFVGARENITTNNYSLACTDSIFTLDKSYGNVNNGAWQTIESLGFPNTPIVRPRFFICVPNSATVTEQACGSYDWNGVTYTSTGVFVDTLTNTGGCDSIVTLNLTIDSIIVTTTVSGDTITADMANANYQWINCNGNTIIAGETSQSFTATASGDYAVIVSNGSCTDTSACVTINLGGIDEATPFNNLSVYPNPTNGVFTIDFERPISQECSLIITNINGQVLHEMIVNESSQSIQMNEYLIPGVYFITLSEENNHSTIRLIVTK